MKHIKLFEQFLNEDKNTHLSDPKITKSAGWYTASFKNKGGEISGDFRTEKEAQEFLDKYFK